MGDAKLENLLHMVQAMIKEVGNPMAVVSLRYIWLFRLGNSLGILQTIPYMKEVLNFAAREMADHKKRHIDGNYYLSNFAKNLASISTINPCLKVYL